MNVAEILRVAQNDTMLKDFNFDRAPSRNQPSLGLINRTDTHTVPCRFGEDVAHPMADGIDTAGFDAILIHQDSFHGIRTTLGELQVIVFRTFGRSIAIDGDACIRIVLQVIGRMLRLCCNSLCKRIC